MEELMETKNTIQQFDEFCNEYKESTEKIDDIKEQINQLKERKRFQEAKRDEHLNAIKSFLAAHNLTEFATPSNNAKWKESPPAVKEAADFDIDNIPDELIRVKKRLNESSIKDSFKKGEISETELAQLGLSVENTEYLAIS